MAESKEQQPRNAAAGQRQKEYAKDQRQETARAFGKQGLTRKNEEFMFQLNKQLDAQGADPAKKPAMLEETLKALQEGQKTGQRRAACLVRQRSEPTRYCTRSQLNNPRRRLH